MHLQFASNLYYLSGAINQTCVFACVFFFIQPETVEQDEDKEKLDRVEASLREREREVYAQQAEFMNEREKEKEKHVKEKATQHFMALMSDMVGIYIVIDMLLAILIST